MPRKKTSKGSKSKGKQTKKASGSKAAAKECTIQVVSAEGNEHSSITHVLSDGGTVAEALKKHGVTHQRKNLMIDGKPVGLDAILTAGCKFTVEERAQGS